MVKKFYVDENFWDTVTELRALEPFRSLYVGDDSVGKERSSKLMWGIALCYDYDSALYSLEERERVESVRRDYLKFDVDEELWRKLKEGYVYLQRDSMRRYLTDLDEKLDERREFIKNLRYDEENWDKLDKMLISTEKLLVQRDSIVKWLEKKEGEALRGDIKPSLLEKNEI